MNNDERHEIVKDGIRNSHPAVERTVEFLGERGYENISINDYTLADSYDQRMAHRDNGDITLGVDVEVKHRPSVHFTGPADWPHKDVIVDSKWKFDNKKTIPFMYVCWSDDLKSCLIIFPSTSKKKWFVKNIYDNRLKREEEFYFTSIDSCIFLTEIDGVMKNANKNQKGQG